CLARARGGRRSLAAKRKSVAMRARARGGACVVPGIVTWQSAGELGLPGHPFPSTLAPPSERRASGTVILLGLGFFSTVESQ
ncbi:unnamed protein product, partial [Amoebophrya sp. A120]